MCIINDLRANENSLFQLRIMVHNVVHSPRGERCSLDRCQVNDGVSADGRWSMVRTCAQNLNAG